MGFQGKILAAGELSNTLVPIYTCPALQTAYAKFFRIYNTNIDYLSNPIALTFWKGADFLIATSGYACVGFIPQPVIVQSILSIKTPYLSEYPGTCSNKPVYYSTEGTFEF